ncbi:BT_3987 domain-containing protein [Pedobacter sp. SYP-B3415]|uniref:BT_3987 domain-containing protein n=1 Tax=Pedobacter sp. SYP-B3415 TaxID=2496641 RepID=UPI0013EA3DDD|nr:DUF1735 domain-containing protein [Pedobacter sp. SYP-B3415]
MKIFKLLIPAVLVTVSLSSCLKNKFDQMNPDGSPSVIEFANPSAPSSETPGGSAFTVFPVSYLSATSTEASYKIQLSGPEPAAQDIIVNVGVRSDAVTKLNDEKKIISSYVPYVELPSSLYTITTPTVTIPAGQRSASVKVAFKTSSFDFSKKYALPIAITSTSFGSPSGNFGTILLNVTAKNEWDGIYSVSSGVVTRYTAPGVPAGDALSGNLAGNPDITATSINGTTVELTNLRWAGGSSAVSGIENLRATINPATNQVTMTSGVNPTLRNIPGKDNKYDPATKTFTLNFDWNQTSTPREMTLVIKYKGSR